ncbi:hypothetical protein Hanom_Chr16g01494141 [Helianthus anomalus]
MDVSENRVRISVSPIFLLFLNFNTIFQIITLGPFKFNFQSHIFFFGKKATRFYFALGHQNG